MGFRRVLHGNQHPTITKSVKPGYTGLEQQRRRHRPEPAHQLDTYRAGSQITLSASSRSLRFEPEAGRSEQPYDPTLRTGISRLNGNWIGASHRFSRRIRADARPDVLAMATTP